MKSNYHKSGAQGGSGIRNPHTEETSYPQQSLACIRNPHGFWVIFSVICHPVMDILSAIRTIFPAISAIRMQILAHIRYAQIPCAPLK